LRFFWRQIAYLAIRGGQKTAPTSRPRSVNNICLRYRGVVNGRQDDYPSRRIRIAVEDDLRVLADLNQAQMTVAEGVLGLVDPEIVEDVPEIDLVLAAFEVVDRIAAEIGELPGIVDPIEEGVVAGIAAHRVLAGTALDDVVAVAAAEEVVA